LKLINKEAYANTLPTDIAGYDFSLLIHVPFGMETINLLFDTGISADCVVENAMRMGLELARAKRYK
jgi:metal-dependent hydrolase (beta-lactamase superfamily II)